MPYNSNQELPARVRSHLPEDAQTVYRETFNRALRAYGASLEVVAHRVAWSAVKRQFEKANGTWMMRTH